MKQVVLIISFAIFLSFLTNLTYGQANGNQLLDRWEFSESELNSAQSDYAKGKGIKFYHFTFLSNNKKVNGYLAAPENTTNNPTILWNDGGSTKYFPFNAEHVPRKFGKLVESGYAVIACNYKDESNGEVKDEFGGEDVEHVVNLIDILHSFPEIDTSAVGMFGWSRGGMMSYMTLVRTNKVKAMVVGGAISDLFLNGQNRPDMEIYVFADLMPDYKISRTAALNRRSAVKWADQFPKDVPILILHGTSDWRVRAEHSLLLAQELSKYRVPYRLILYEGGDHGISEYREEQQTETLEWFNRFLIRKEKLPNMEFHGR
ncbi:alpha/beta hydrolase family protein [Marinigracilibium pacificum]|uniref:Prolyl oligopeptidase family serine peptidase n=1 Tax=Marinigracilibium pacificum TaxID=2729599 RepID=A0A848J0W5_9BACT|nr:prolyl oligopeptidase family serine peptidase [Marinigracilibium pacificum]NMM48124.1 prolyl oligopeptidase family serine peptidase [Marinigracilibium pacificum]